MIWVNSISELQYYNQPPAPAPCYCEHLVYPNDLLLQGSFSSNATSGFTLTVDVYEPDGVTLLEASATSLGYFEYYFFSVNGVRYFNLRLKSYSPAMCTNPCWILKVTVSVGADVLFQKWTQRYCQASCCDIPRGITFAPGGIETVSETPVTVSTFTPQGNCGKPLIRIEVEFPCLDNQLAEFYGIPTTVYSGTASFAFKKITNITGKIRQRPREISREISYNCNLQRAESFKPFLLESVSASGVFPVWKMNELEGMFHAPEIFVTDFYTEGTYQFDGGLVVEQIYKCWEIFKLKVTLQTCTIRQTYGCDEDCERTNQKEFLIPENSQGVYYSENNVLIGDFDQLLQWYRGQNGITTVTDTSGDYDNTAGSFTVEGSSYIPSFFYFDNISPRNKVFGVYNPEAPVISCVMPVIGTIIIEEDECATPVLGTVVIEEEETTEITIAEYENWIITDADTGGEVAGGIGRFDIHVENTTLAPTSPLVFFNGEIIGTIEPNNAPSAPRSIEIDENTLITIDTLGVIRFTGYATSYSDPTIVIQLTNIYYTL